MQYFIPRGAHIRFKQQLLEDNKKSTNKHRKHKQASLNRKKKKRTKHECARMHLHPKRYGSLINDMKLMLLDWLLIS